MAESVTHKLPAPFGKYLLTQLIAVGGMAEVYRAKIFGASGFEKDMVVKRILPKYAQNPNFVQMLIDEAKIAVSLSHGNIVPIYELGELDGSYYIAMEYVEGRTVLDILRDAHSKRHPIPWAYCLSIAADVAKGLAYAHARVGSDGQPLGLVHRDINPRNIVVTPAGEVKILDFGIARASTKLHQTASGVIKGTPGYMSPEQMYGHRVDSRSDIYCLGILVYELLTLRRLFPVWDVNEMRAVFEAGPIPLPSSIARNVATSVDPVIMKALTQDVTQRFQTGNQFEEALRQTIATSGVAVTSGGLAREVQALDDAPGPKAPRTAPPIASSSVNAAPAPKPEAQSSRDSAQGPSGDPSSVALAHAPTQPKPASQAGHGPERATSAERPRSNPSAGTAPSGQQHAPPAGAAPTPNTRSTQSAGVRTQPMPAQKDMAPAKLDADYSFVISLAQQKPAPTALAPLPATSAQAVSQDRQRTLVLAQNPSIGWASEVGEDAEWRAFLKATGATPGGGRRGALIAAALAGVALVALLVSQGDVLIAGAQRALSGKKQELGVMVFKTIPSGAEVVVDNKLRGKTNLKLAQVDVDVPHRIVVKPKDKDPIVLEITREDFQKGEDGLPTYLFERDFGRPDAGPAP